MHGGWRVGGWVGMGVEGGWVGVEVGGWVGGGGGSIPPVSTLALRGRPHSHTLAHSSRQEYKLVVPFSWKQLKNDASLFPH